MENITIKEFAEQVREEVAARLDDTYEVSVNEVLKNNGVKYTGLVIRNGGVVAPTIYVDGAFRAFTERGYDMEMIVDGIMDKFNEADMVSFDASNLTGFDKAKGRICFQLVNATRNEELLANTPHKQVAGDLCKIYVIMAGEFDDGIASAKINNSLMERWGVTLEDIDKIANENTPNLLPASVRSITSVMAELMGVDEEELNEVGALPIDVATNRNRTNGAGVILYDNILKEYADKVGTDVYILPSSIHETLLVPATDAVDRDALARMVPCINSTELEAIDFLSDNIFMYHRDTAEITVA